MSKIFDTEEIAQVLFRNGVMVRTVLTAKGWVADIKFVERDRIWTYLFPKETDPIYIHPKHFKTQLELYEEVAMYLQDTTIEKIFENKEIPKFIRESFVSYELDKDEYGVCISGEN